MDFYEILGCTNKSTPDELRKAWRKLCMEHHPDKGGDPEMFIKITHAYRMLSDPSYARTQSHRPPTDLTFNVQMVITFNEAFYGTKLVVSYNQIELDGSYTPIKTEDVIDPVVVSFDLPPGSMKFQHVEKGKGKKHNSDVGNAVITVASQKHPRYSVKGIDVFVEEKVKLEVMLKGDYISVETLWGIKVVWVPPGTVPGSKIRVVGCGVDKKGHQYCLVQPIYPDQDELKNKEAWKNLGINWTKVDQQNKEDDDLFDKFEAMKK